jgi:hypothetical protein
VGILRKRLSRGFTITPTATLDDMSLSYRDLGILSYLISRPEGWTVSYKGLMKSSERFGREGEKAVLQSLRNLRAAGYYHIEQVRGSDGRIRTLTHISDTPVLAWMETKKPEFPQVAPSGGKALSGATRENDLTMQVAPNGSGSRNESDDHGLDDHAPDQVKLEFPQVAPSGGLPGSGKPPFLVSTGEEVLEEKEKDLLETRESEHDQEPQEDPVTQQDHPEDSSVEELARASQRISEISQEIGDRDRDLFAGSHWDRYRGRQTFGDVRAPEPEDPEPESDRDRFRLSFPKIDISDLTF